jgi:hypothetical protein
MMRFTFTDTTRFLPDPNDSLYQLEAKVDKLHELPPHQQLSLLYNDATNYMNAKLTPYEAWYKKRVEAVRGYASLDWLAFGQYLNPKSPTLGNVCTTIYRQLQELVSSSSSSPPFSLPLFCSTLAKIDQLWHIILPSHVEGIQDPALLALLAYCGRQV